MDEKIEIPSDVWERINEQTGTDIISIVMDAVNNTDALGRETSFVGRSDASKTMDLIAERCAAAYREGYRAGMEKKV